MLRLYFADGTIKVLKDYKFKPSHARSALIYGSVLFRYEKAHMQGDGFILDYRECDKYSYTYVDPYHG